MTQNQINYAKLQEEKRHNLATEGYTGIELQESARHNLATEGANWYSATEQGRHNQAQENINWYSAQNLADLQYWQGQQNQSQAFLNDTKAILESAQFDLDKWFKEQSINLNSVDAATRERAQYAAERKINAEIEDVMRRLNIEEAKAGLVREQISSEIKKNIASGSYNVAQLIKIIGDLILST